MASRLLSQRVSEKCVPFVRYGSGSVKPARGGLFHNNYMYKYKYKPGTSMHEICVAEGRTYDQVFVPLVSYKDYMPKLQARNNALLVVGLISAIIGHYYLFKMCYGMDTLHVWRYSKVTQVPVGKMYDAGYGPRSDSPCFVETAMEAAESA